jgi:RNA polymerase sigma factor (sigma-70 family)
MARHLPKDLSLVLEEARNGDRAALADLVEHLQDGIYRLAVRMLYHPADAEDATQEILIKIVTHLGSFRGDAEVSTWAYRIAANHLLTTRKRSVERRELTFEQCEQMLEPRAQTALSEEFRQERHLLIKEMRISCLQALLMCLDRKHRLALLLGEVFELTSTEAAAVLDITPAAYRQQLSRARASMLAFFSKNCSLVRDGAPCTCEGHVGLAVSTGVIRPHRMLFATHPVTDAESSMQPIPDDELDELNRITRLYREVPKFRAPGSIQAALRTALGGAPLNTDEERVS